METKSDKRSATKKAVVKKANAKGSKDTKKEASKKVTRVAAKKKVEEKLSEQNMVEQKTPEQKTPEQKTPEQKTPEQKTPEQKTVKNTAVKNKKDAEKKESKKVSTEKKSARKKKTASAKEVVNDAEPEVIAETIESGNLGGETQEAEFIFLKHYSFIARYDNVQLANITLNNLKCVIYECDATSREDALNMFVEAIKDTGVSDVKRLFKKTFGENIIVESGVLNNIEVERVSTDNIDY